LYVQTENMAPHGEKPLWLPAEEMHAALDLVQNPPVLPKPLQRRPPGRAQLAGLATQEKLNAMALARAAQVASSTKKLGSVSMSSTLSMSATQILDAVWPTYRIRPYYDTGRTVTNKGVASKVLAPMATFGFRMSHDGSFYGFVHELTAANPGVEVKKISDYWYVVHFKNESMPLRLRTKISAEERPVAGGPDHGPSAPPCPECPVKPRGCGCELAGSTPRTGITLTGIVVLVVGLGLRRRRNRARSRATPPAGV
jgi:MYXO-CTERM domain-containing protein